MEKDKEKPCYPAGYYRIIGIVGFVIHGDQVKKVRKTALELLHVKSVSAPFYITARQRICYNIKKKRRISDGKCMDMDRTERGKPYVEKS